VTVVQQYVSAQNAHDYNKMGTLVADSIETGTLFADHGVPAKTSKESRSQHLAQVTRVMTRFPRIRFEIISILSEGNIVVTRELFSGGSEAGSEIGVSLYRVNGGKIDYMLTIPPK
jgi:predicted ester cyclase